MIIKLGRMDSKLTAPMFHRPHATHCCNRKRTAGLVWGAPVRHYDAAATLEVNLTSKADWLSSKESLLAAWLPAWLG